jgi:hypothetical protein
MGKRREKPAGPPTVSGFAYDDPGYIAAATDLKAKRARYFETATGEAEAHEATRAHMAYEQALRVVRAEEDRVLAMRNTVGA